MVVPGSARLTHEISAGASVVLRTGRIFDTFIPTRCMGDAPPKCYNKATADLAWGRTINWFDKYARTT